MSFPTIPWLTSSKLVVVVVVVVEHDVDKLGLLRKRRDGTTGKGPGSGRKKRITGDNLDWGVWSY